MFAAWATSTAKISSAFNIDGKTNQFFMQLSNRYNKMLSIHLTDQNLANKSVGVYVKFNFNNCKQKEEILNDRKCLLIFHRQNYRYDTPSAFS